MRQYADVGKINYAELFDKTLDRLKSLDIIAYYNYFKNHLSDFKDKQVYCEQFLFLTKEKSLKNFPKPIGMDETPYYWIYGALAQTHPYMLDNLQKKSILKLKYLAIKELLAK